jgi:hypothetical protein
MLRAFLPIFLAAVALAFWVYTIIDCVRTDNYRIRGLPKPVWVLVVIVLPLIGGLLWLTIGRGRGGPAAQPSTRKHPLYPDDDAEFLNRVSTEREREARIRDLEDKLAELDDESDDKNKPQA